MCDKSVFFVLVMSPIFMEFSYLWKLPFGIFPRAHCPCVKKRVDKMVKFPRVQSKELLVVPDFKKCWHEMRGWLRRKNYNLMISTEIAFFVFYSQTILLQFIRWFSLRVAPAECPWDGGFLSCSEGNWTVTKHSLNSAFAFDPTLDMVK